MKCVNRSRGHAQAAVIFLCSAIMAGCGANGTTAGTESRNAPTTVVLGSGSESAVQDYQARVKVFYSNNRLAAGPSLARSYKLSTRAIDGNLYTRVDMDENTEQGIPARSVITGPGGTLVLAQGGETVEQRLPPKAELAGSLAIGEKSLFAKINVADVRSRMTALGYDAIDDGSEGSGHTVILEAPASLLPKSYSGATATGYRVMFDSEAGTLSGTETVERDSAGVTITKRTTKYYQEKDGVMVPVGERLEVIHDYPGRIEVDTAENPRIDSVDQLDTMSESEFAELQAQGAAHEVPMAVVGDPADPDYTETWLTVYETVTTNCLQDSLFLPGEGI